MRGPIIIIIALLHILLAATAFAAVQTPLFQVYGNRTLDDQAILKMSGLAQYSDLSNTEAERRLLSSNLFSTVMVQQYPNKNLTTIVVNEKTSWFALPYFSTDSNATIYGTAAGKAGLFGQNATLLGRYQFGTGNHEGSFLIRNEFFLNSLWALGASFDYEHALHRIFGDRQVVHRTDNKYHGGSLQFGYHLSPYILLGLNTYIEEHRFEEPNGEFHEGLQFSHKLIFDFGNLYSNEGLLKGSTVRIYLESTNPASFFQFRKIGILTGFSAFLKGDFNWVIRPRYEGGATLPRYQLIEIGGIKLRSFPIQMFRGEDYVSLQNDFMLASLDVWKIKLRPMLYTDWAFIEGSGRTGIGGGFHVYFRSVAVPAIQFFAGYGFHPDGFAVSAAVGPQI
jgi:hypothetical protein